MDVSRNAYYNWKRNRNNKKIKPSTSILMQRIRFHFYQSKQIYGSPKIHKMLEIEGLLYSRSYVGLLMRQMGLKSILKRKHVVTTDSNHDFDIADNKLDRDFTTTIIGEKWVSDITYIRVNEHWNYLTTIIDLADRKVVGWSLSEDMTTENTVSKAWVNAIKNRTITDNFIFHSDRGVQYASNKMRIIFNTNTKITQSMSRKGNCWDNAVAESFFKSIKNEWLYRFNYKSYSQLYYSIEEYIQWYNTKRIHESLGYLTPIQMESKLRNNNKMVA